MKKQLKMIPASLVICFLMIFTSIPVQAAEIIVEEPVLVEEEIAIEEPVLVEEEIVVEEESVLVEEEVVSEEEPVLAQAPEQEPYDGYVTISIEDNGIRIEGETGIKYPNAFGMIVEATQVGFYEGDTIAQVTLRLLDEKGLTYRHGGTATSGFYLQWIGGFTVGDEVIESFGEFDGGGQSGWMITWNDWFINKGASEFTVNDKDVIKWMYTCQLGDDIGDTFFEEDSELANVNKLISALIGMDITLESEAAILEARAAYDALSSAQKVQITNYSFLLEAENALFKLKEPFTFDAIEDVYYTGKAQKPAVNVYDNGTLLKAGKDYTLSYGNNVDAGAVEEEDLPYVIITGKGNYSGEWKQNFRILPLALADEAGEMSEDVVLKYTDQATEGTDFKPLTSIKYGKITMKEGRDFSVKVTKSGSEENLLNNGTLSNAEKGDYTLIIEGNGKNFVGKIEKNIHVAAKVQLLKNAKITLAAKSAAYAADGAVLAAEDIKVTMGKTVLQADTDYTVSYRNNKKVGTATLIVKGVGDYAGTKTAAFQVTGTKLTSKNVTISRIADQPYTGSAIKPEATLTLNAGTDMEKALVNGTDYTVTSYKNNTKKGTATITFTGKAEAGYTGSVKTTFKIKAANLEDVSVEVKDAEYSKSGAQPEAVLKLGSYTLKKGTDYTVSYKNNKAVTTEVNLPTVVIKGKGNFTGTKNQTFTITEKSIADSSISITVKPEAYNAKKPDAYQYKASITVKDGKTKLTEGKDYTVEGAKYNTKKMYDEWVKSGCSSTSWIRPYVTIEGIGSYKGSLDVDLNIYNIKLSKNNTCVVVEERASIYNGRQLTPDVRVYYSEDKAVIKQLNKASASERKALIKNLLKDGSLSILEDDDYTVTAGKNIFAGKNKGTVTITGMGHFGGSIKQNFTISSKNISF